MSTQSNQLLAFAECKVCMKDLSKPKFGGKIDDGVRKFIINAQDPSRAVCCSCGFTTLIDNLVTKEIREVSLEDIE